MHIIKRHRWSLLTVAMATGGCGGTEDVAGICSPACPANQHCQAGVCLGAEVWSVPLPVNVEGEIAVAHDGTLIATGAQPDDELYRPTAYALSPDGELLWERQVGRIGPWGFPSRPVLGIDERIFVAVNRSLYALELDGFLDWTLDTPVSMVDFRPIVNAADPPPSPSVGTDGTVYWQFVAATTKDGELQWRQYIDPYTPCETPLPARPDRILFRGGQQLFALGTDGEVVWNLDTPLGYETEVACTMMPYRDGLVATSWCAPGASAFVCGHVLFIDLETGEPAWVTPPPVQVAAATAMLLAPDGGILLFSSGPGPNPDNHSRMWRIEPDGVTTGESIQLPFHDIVGAALGDDGIVYAATNRGLAAITETGEILWRYEPDGIDGTYSGAPAIGENGCVYYEAVTVEGRAATERHVVCLKSSATGLAASAWPHSLGGNHNGYRSP